MVQIFVTGGTFDKEYNYLTGELYFKNTHISDLLTQGRNDVPVDIKTLMMIDSLDMSDEDRKIILHNCRKTKHKDIIITHGTDTMVETAKVIAGGNLKDKTIIITGALIPAAFGNSSDGFFNLGASLTISQVLEPGVYICMNGKIFNWDNVKKNKATGFFEEL